MPDERNEPRVIKGRHITTIVEHDVGEPIDIDAWVEEYVALGLELLGIKPRVAPPVPHVRPDSEDG